MEIISVGDTGPSVEDVQLRLIRLGYVIDEAEKSTQSFGESTAAAVAAFRQSQHLSPNPVIDLSAWSLLVDESYELGERSLYLRLPNYHGADVRQLQERLNILGFSCGAIDGYFGGHTERALKLFQESIGEVADGMMFNSTFEAIERLRHIWGGKPAEGPHPSGTIGYARTASMLEQISLAICATDPISRNIAGRIVNLLKATDETCRVATADSPKHVDPSTETLLILSSGKRPTEANRIYKSLRSDAGFLVYTRQSGFARRLRAAFQSALSAPATVLLHIPLRSGDDFTLIQAQSYAVALSDAICEAFTGFTQQ